MSRSLLKRGTLLTPADNGTYEPIRSHQTPSPYSGFTLESSGRVICGIDATLGKVWSFASNNLYQVDSLVAPHSWSALSLPAGVTTVPEAAVVTYTPATGIFAGTPLMLALLFNAGSGLWGLYSAPVGLKSAAPAWSLVQAFSTNATIIPTALRTTSYGVYAGEYSSTLDIVGGPSLYLTVDGVSASTVIGPLGANTRHFHSVYEDPYNIGTVYTLVGDFFSPYNPPFGLYKSTNGAAFVGVSTTAILAWQAVSMAFDSDWIYFWSDQSSGWNIYAVDRATYRPRWITTKTRHDRLNVPGGAAGRVITDAAFASNATMTSAAQGNFTAADKGRVVRGNGALTIETFLAAIGSATSVTLSVAASNSTSGQTVYIGGDSFYAGAYIGARDPATGFLYICANDTSGAGTTPGLFMLTGWDEALTLLYALPGPTLSHYEMFIAGGRLWVGGYSWPLLTGALPAPS